MKNWYLIYTKPRQESTAQVHLQAQGYTAHLSCLSVKKRTAKGWQVVSEPLFPNYLFVLLDDATDNWKPIRSTRGVSALVRFGDGLPSPVLNGVMQQLLNVDTEQLSQALTHYPKAGDRVNLQLGQSTLNALVQASDGRGRVQVLFELLGQQNSAWVDLQQVHPA